VRPGGASADISRPMASQSWVVGSDESGYLPSVVELVEHVVGSELALIWDRNQRLPLAVVRATCLLSLLLPNMRLVVEFVESLHELVQLLVVGVGVTREVIRRPLQLVVAHDMPASHSLVTLDAVLIESPSESDTSEVREWKGESEGPVVLENKVLGDHAVSVPDEDIHVQGTGTPVLFKHGDGALYLLIEITIQRHEVELDVTHRVVESPEGERGESAGGGWDDSCLGVRTK
jgi:hypothetical protein